MGGYDVTAKETCHVSASIDHLYNKLSDINVWYVAVCDTDASPRITTLNTGERTPSGAPGVGAAWKVLKQDMVKHTQFVGSNAVSYHQEQTTPETVKLVRAERNSLLSFQISQAAGKYGVTLRLASTSANNCTVQFTMEYDECPKYCFCISLGSQLQACVDGGMAKFQMAVETEMLKSPRGSQSPPSFGGSPQQRGGMM